MSVEPFLAQITFFPYDFAPLNWIECAGQLLPISQYSALFGLLGTQYGGNGTSNFALPDLRGRVPLGMGQLGGGSDYDLGEDGGAESVSVTVATMASHSHSLNATTDVGTVNNPAGAILAAAFTGVGVERSTAKAYNPGTPNTTLVPATLAQAGGKLPHNNIQPSLVLRPCIALRGIYPQRG